MSYKTILVHVDATPESAERTRVAAQIAATFEAHLVGVAPTGLPAAYLMPGGYGEAMVDMAQILAQQRDNASAALAAFDSAAERHGVQSRETRMVEEESGVALCLHARYGDLVILSQGDSPAPPAFERSDVAPYVLLHAGRPVLMLPHPGPTGAIGNRILVAWDASVSAMRAVNDALPLLRRAATVEILVFTPAQPDQRKGEQPGTDLAQYLARHHVNVVVTELAAPSDMTIGDSLLAHAALSQADLLVMGGYGHTRLRELVLGGVTRAVLGAMTLPVLMSH